MSEPGRDQPQKAPLAFRVGVVGHRPNRLKHASASALQQVLKDILARVQWEVSQVAEAQAGLYASGVPRLTAVSPLAEGTDRWFAEAALDLGFGLCCVMPFAEPEYRKDFALGQALEPASLARFDQLLERARRQQTEQARFTRLELDGTRGSAGLAYGTAGRVVINQSDLLIVVWDGEVQGKVGGTEETFVEARRQSVPVVWVDAHAPHGWQILGYGDALPSSAHGERAVPHALSSSLDDIGSQVRKALALPALDAPVLR